MSRTKNLIDENLSVSIKDLLAKDEEVIWEGKPKKNNSFAFLESGASFDPFLRFHSPLGTVLGFGGFIGSYFFYYDNYVGLTITVFVSLAILIIPEFIKSQRRKNTKYLVTDRRIFFSLWNWGKGQIDFLNYEDIGQINLETFKDKSGNIYFFTALDTRIKTYDFTSGYQRHCPTFEEISGVKELTNKILKLKLDRKKFLTS